MAVGVYFAKIANALKLNATNSWCGKGLKDNTLLSTHGISVNRLFGKSYAYCYTILLIKATKSVYSITALYNSGDRSPSIFPKNHMTLCTIVSSKHSPDAYKLKHWLTIDRYSKCGTINSIMTRLSSSAEKFTNIEVISLISSLVLSSCVFNLVWVYLKKRESGSKRPVLSTRS